MCDDLVGIKEIAKYFGVRPSAVVNWEKRHFDFPPAIARLACGPIFLMSEIREWELDREYSLTRK